MSLTSYRAAPPRDGGGFEVGRGERLEGRLLLKDSGLSAPRRDMRAAASGGDFKSDEEEGPAGGPGRATDRLVVVRTWAFPVIRALQAWRRPTLPCLETKYHWR